MKENNLKIIEVFNFLKYINYKLPIKNKVFVHLCDDGLRIRVDIEIKGKQHIYVRTITHKEMDEIKKGVFPEEYIINYICEDFNKWSSVWKLRNNIK